MPDRTRLTRRTLLSAAVGGAALATAPLATAATPHQTEGPFFPTKNPPEKDFDMTRLPGRSDVAHGEVIEISGRILDEAGRPVEGALVDVWQANAYGRYDHERDTSAGALDPAFQGWAQLRTGADGTYRVRTVKPGKYGVELGWDRPPHLHFKVARRGYDELTTQMYFAGEPLNDIDRLLQKVPAANRASLVVAFADAADAAPRRGVFDIVLKKV
jgi:protocatechuate 3,4-dioxygenase beta subunit